MTQKDLEVIFKDSYNKLLNSTFSLDELTKKIEELSNEDGKVDPNELAQFFFFENMKFTQHYLYEVLSKVLLK